MISGSAPACALSHTVSTLQEAMSIMMYSNEDRPLSDREVKVLRLIASGKTSEAIAGELSISVATVRTHVSNIFKKIQVHSRAEAVAYAIRHRWLDVGP